MTHSYKINHLYQRHRGMPDELFVHDEVIDWLKDHNIGYRLVLGQHEPSDERIDWQGGTRQLCFLVHTPRIEIDDPNQAMLFKLTWM